MTANIFISYSRNDSADALALTEKLRAEGFTVWIDQQGIGAATSWSGEIVDAIEGCSVFIVLLSRTSVASQNVVREVTLAFENNRKIIPVEIEPVELPREFKYHLAGIQRTSFDKVDAIVAAVLSAGTAEASNQRSSNFPQAKKLKGLHLIRRFKRLPRKVRILCYILLLAAIFWNFGDSSVDIVDKTNDGFSKSAEASWHKYGSKIPEANQLFERAVTVRAVGDSAHMDESKRLLENAIALDSNFALAYVNLAGMYADNDSLQFAMARKLTRKALLINPALPAAYAMSGFIALADKDTVAAFEYGNKGVALSDSTSNMSWNVLRDCYISRNEYALAYRAELGVLGGSHNSELSAGRFYLSWLGRNQDSLANLYPAKWIERWIKTYRQMPQNEFLLFVIVTALDDLNDPRLSEYLPKLQEKAETDPSAMTAIAFYNAHRHNDAELLKNLQLLKKKWGVPKMLTENSRFQYYKDKPAFQQYIRIAK